MRIILSATCMLLINKRERSEIRFDQKISRQSLLTLSIRAAILNKKGNSTEAAEGQIRLSADTEWAVSV